MCALIEYGYAVFTGWGISGLLHQRAAAHKGTPGANRIPETLRLDPDDAMSLAGELIVTVIDTFRAKVLAKGKWSELGGASLKTYFVGWCLMHLPDTYVRWNRRERSGGRAESLDDPTADLSKARVVDLAAVTDLQAEARIELEIAVAAVDDPQIVQMFQLQAAGYALEAIAEILDVTESVVRTKMSRARIRMRKWKVNHRAS